MPNIVGWISAEPPDSIMNLLDSEKKAELVRRHIDMQIEQLKMLMKQLGQQIDYLNVQREMLK